MKSSRLIGLAIIVVVTGAGAIIHGRSSQRWGASEQMTLAGQRLTQIEQQIPGWRFVSTDRIAESSREMLETTGDIVRVYDDPLSGSKVNVSVIVGPPGTISVHSPEICLPSRNFNLLGKRQEVTVRDTSGVEHRLWKVSFQSQDASQHILQVYYAWSDGGAWMAPESPRYSYVGKPHLYKVQLAGYSSTGDPSDDQSISFLREFLPAVSRELVNTAQVPLSPDDED